MDNPANCRFFDEDFIHPKATADAPRFIEFDWECLRRHLGESKEALSERDYAALGDALNTLLSWVVVGYQSISNRKLERLIRISLRGSDVPQLTRLMLVGLRALSLAWVVNPNLFNGASIRQLSAVVGVEYQKLGSYTVAARRRFGVCNSKQKRLGWRFKHKPVHRTSKPRSRAARQRPPKQRSAEKQRR